MNTETRRHGESLIDEELTGRIIAAAIEVHRELGPGLLESAYEMCLCRELDLRGIPFERQRPLPVNYKGVKLESGYRIDLVVAEKVIVELKTVDHIAPVHEVQLRTYLELTSLRVGHILNFYVPALAEGIKRVVL